MIKKLFFLLCLLASNFSVASEQYYWLISLSTGECSKKFSTAEELGSCVASIGSIARNFTTSYGGDCAGGYVSFLPGNFTLPFPTGFIAGYGYINVVVDCPAYIHPYYGAVPALHQNIQFDVSVQSYSYFAATTADSNPPQTCAFNPIEIGTGIKIQREDDVVSKGEGQVGFVRYYNNVPNGAVGWHFSYQQALNVVDVNHASEIIAKSSLWVGKKDACESGWSQIKNKITASWAVNATAAMNGDACEVIQNGVVVHNLLLIDGIIEPNTIMGGLQSVRESGSVISYQISGANVRSTSGDKGKMERVDIGNVMWRYTTESGQVEEYSLLGKLLTLTARNGMKQRLSYDSATGLLSQVQDATGRKIQFGYTGMQLTSITTDDNKTTSYTYNGAGLITDVKRPDNTHRLYHYEDSRFPAALTGITDERGVRYATWTYDAQGRAITSQHAGGVEFGSLSYNADGSTTTTDTLGKQTIYRFADIAGTRRVTSVEGQPTSNCVGANKNYTYTPEGWIASKTDWNGNKVTYQYNTKGQEVSRTEAAGSAVAKTITTEWHPAFNLKTKVTEPDKETAYSYDANGLLLNQNTRSLP